MISLLISNNIWQIIFWTHILSEYQLLVLTHGFGPFWHVFNRVKSEPTVRSETFGSLVNIFHVDNPLWKLQLFLYFLAWNTNLSKKLSFWDNLVFHIWGHTTRAMENEGYLTKNGSRNEHKLVNKELHHNILSKSPVYRSNFHGIMISTVKLNGCSVRWYLK